MGKAEAVIEAHEGVQLLTTSERLSKEIKSVKKGDKGRKSV